MNLFDCYRESEFQENSRLFLAVTFEFHCCMQEDIEVMMKEIACKLVIMKKKTFSLTIFNPRSKFALTISILDVEFFFKNSLMTRNNTFQAGQSIYCC